MSTPTVYTMENDPDLIVGGSIRKHALIISPGVNASPVVTIEQGGGVVIGPGYEPDEAARIFWKAVESANPMHHEVERLKQVLRTIRCCAKTAESAGDMYDSIMTIVEKELGE